METQMLLIPVGILIVAAVVGLSKAKISLKMVSTLSAIASVVMIYIGILGFEATLELKYNLFNSSSLFTTLNWLVFRVDSLSAFFLLLLGILSLCASVYGIKYMEKYLGKEDMRVYTFNYPIFLLTMYFVLICWNLLWFIIFWELMSLFSQFLVAFEQSEEKAVKAAFKYFCMTKAGAEFLVLAVVLIILKVTSFNADYSEIASILPAYLSAHLGVLYALTFALLIGFGVKAAMIPFHSWLPDAHPEAPSNVSALLSGIMIKLPIYMMLRFFITFFPLEPEIGLIIAVFGVLTLFFSMMYALLQEDSKRLLAFSSIDNIGYILLPMGAGIYFLANGNQLLGSVALAAALFHTMNHAFFKGLLFLTAGSVMYETGTRDLNYLGSLAKKMPLTAFAALIGSLAIAGMPPLNGFVSKWMIYISTLSSPATSLFGIIAIFISAVTLGAFVKYFTAIFTKPAVKEINAKEVPLLMSAPQILLALLCIAFGIYPFVPLKMISQALGAIGVPLASLVVYPSLVVPKTGSYSPVIVFAFLLVSTLIALLILPSKGSVMSTWKTGRSEDLNVGMPADAYYRDFREAFNEVYLLGDASKDIVQKVARIGKAFGTKFEVLSYDLDSMLSLAMILIVILVAVLGGVSL
ncbi:proton-conducting transporter transmembrane domain-containing protein [Thermococcus barophilus]|uniref:Membrane bound subgroup 4b [NiFe]-hydrogenase MBH(B)2, subunit Mbh(B)2H n=1 Tax=Thermococcus barophilus TaxID=55802 RepID=A0A0S1XBX8_THEBA|nr:proton-conducting transporter membrane subunit [Thermococcus barophilus]ALM75286.1 Membrane bound subgroup 4b [NiFe]-hydrogenase MBH(b)2, subunit Mbh(b)2H [Thermococcus barophilus]